MTDMDKPDVLICQVYAQHCDFFVYCAFTAFFSFFVCVLTYLWYENSCNK